VYAALLNELRLAQELVAALLEGLDDAASRQQYHAELSPPGWHLGHCAYTECYWLQQVVLGDDRHTRAVEKLYTPGLTPKPVRGKALPPLHGLLQWVSSMQTMNQQLFDTRPQQLMQHPLMQDNYLLHFLIQHYSQHYETMLSVLTERTLAAGTPHRVQSPMSTQAPSTAGIEVQAGHYKVGGKPPAAYDNELPVQHVMLGPYRIAPRPVSNSQYLAFMQAGGYQEQAHWSKAGWQWRAQTQTCCPHHWRQDADKQWYGTGIRGTYDLDGEDSLHGLSQFEAAAYAHWAGGRLPHEHQWEVACRLQHLEDSGRAWEWCHNRFFAYAGFKAFPYEGYSMPAFDGEHYSLRGGSLHTRPAIKRPAFRNFHAPDKRHIFAGLRLVFDTENE